MFFLPPPFWRPNRTRITLAQALASTADSSSYSFTGSTLGNPFPGRKIIICAGCENSTTSLTVSSATLGGVAADKIVEIGSADTPIAMFMIANETDSIADLVVNISAGALNCGAALFVVRGLQSTTPIDTATSTASPGIVNIDSNERGAGLAFSFHRNSTTRTYTWTGLTEAFDQIVESGRSAMSGAILDFTTTTADFGVTCTLSGSVGSLRTIAASFR